MNRNRFKKIIYQVDNLAVATHYCEEDHALIGISKLQRYFTESLLLLFKRTFLLKSRYEL